MHGTTFALWASSLLSLVTATQGGENATLVQTPFLRAGRLGDSVPFTVKLRRETKPGLAANGADFGVYMADMRVGRAWPGEEEQVFRVAFDLGSGQVVLPSWRCHDVTCLKHRRYNKWKSQTAIDINSGGAPVLHGVALLEESQARKVGHDEVEIDMDSVDLGPGSVRGDLESEEVCVGLEHAKPRCITMGLAAAASMSDLPFRVLPNDGVVGLGLDSVSLGAKFNFLRNYMEQTVNPAKQVGLLLSGPEGGEISFGGYNSKHVKSPFMWTPVLNPEEGFWQVDILEVHLGNQSLNNLCHGGCRAIIDTTASHLSMPATLASGFEQKVRAALPDQGDVSNAELHMILPGSTISLPVDSYISNPGCLKMPQKCQPLVSRHNIPEPAGKGLLIFGESVLRSYYTVFDWGSKRIGFSSKSTARRKGLKAAVANKPQARADETKTLFLVQLTFRRSSTKLVI